MKHILTRLIGNKWILFILAAISIVAITVGVISYLKTESPLGEQNDDPPCGDCGSANVTEELPHEENRSDIGFDIHTFGKRHPELEKALLNLLGNSSGESEIFSEQTAGMLNGAAVSDDGVAVVDFKDFSQIIPNAATTASKAKLNKEINSAVFQFNEIDTVYYQFDGSFSDWCYWLETAEEPITRENFQKQID